MKIKYNNINFDIKVKNESHIKLGEKSRAFRKLYKALKLPNASFSTNSHIGGDVMLVSMDSKLNEEEDKTLDQLKKFFQNTDYDAITDYYFNDHKNKNPFAFSYVQINYIT